MEVTWATRGSSSGCGGSVGGARREELLASTPWWPQQAFVIFQHMLHNKHHLGTMLLWACILIHPSDRSQTEKGSTKIVRLLYSASFLTSNSLGRESLSTSVQSEIKDEGSKITGLTARVSCKYRKAFFPFHQFFFGTEQKSITAHFFLKKKKKNNSSLQIYNFPNLEVQLLSLL